MQINGTNNPATANGPTAITTTTNMAASEPPEPPPRNPERINASLHKLSESKNIKSFDSARNQNDRSVNNNKPLKTILSLDNSIITTSASSTVTNTTNSKICNSGSGTSVVLNSPSAANAITTNSLYNKRPVDSNASAITSATASITPLGGAAVTTLNKSNTVGSCIVGGATEAISLLSPGSSGGNQTLISSPMTVDNQLQQQQQRLSFISNKTDSTSICTNQQQQQHQQTLMTQQQQQLQQLNGGHRNGSNFSEAQIQPQQLINGLNTNSNSNNSTTNCTNGTVLTALNANNSNTIIGGNHTQGHVTSNLTSAQPAIESVDKKNANNIRSTAKLMDCEQETSTGQVTGTATTITTTTQASIILRNHPKSFSTGIVQITKPTTATTNTGDSARTIISKTLSSFTPKRQNKNTKMSTSTTTTTTTTTATSATTITKDPMVTNTTTTTTTTASMAIHSTPRLSNSNNYDDNRNNEHDTNHNDNQFYNNSHNDQEKLHYLQETDSPSKLREENERLNAEISRLRKLLENSPEGAVGGIDLSDFNSCLDASTDANASTPQQRAERLESELRAARSQIMTLRIERKKLRSDKSELLGQVKQLCTSLQDKEQELRDFIRNYQERVRETETNNAKLSGDRERERWQLLKQARDEAERSLALAQQLNARDMQLQRLQEQLQDARRQLSGCLSDQESLLSFAPLTPPSVANQMSTTGTGAGSVRADDSGRGNSLSAFSGSSGATVGDRNSCSNDSVLRNNSDRESTGGDLNFSDGTCENGPCITVDPDSISLVSSQNMYQYGTPKERSPTLSPLNSAAYSRSVEQLGSPVEQDGPAGALSRKFTPKTGALGARNGRGGTWGSISRVFARSRNKTKALSADAGPEYTDYSWSPLSEEGYAEKLRLLREASQLPMERWRASQVLAWLEVALGMPQYSSRCAENVKSGKVLLELNDAELEAGLGLAHPMHRKKLRLAIEEQRRPEMVRYPMITQLNHTWVASEWLPDIGLPQYAEAFLHSLVDARMLDTLSKKELEKFLGVTRKFHQASIVHGIHVLRIVKYDRQTLAMRRVQSETVDTDPIVWTNQRFIRWARSIDLGEYADNLKDSGVHGGLVVLEPSFSGDTMATALGIPPSKNIIRRHLTTEFDTLILPARYIVYCQMEEFQMDNAARQLILNQKPLAR